MWICSCNEISDKQIDEAIKSGAQTVSQIYKMIGCKAQCEVCVPYIKEKIKKSKKLIRSDGSINEFEYL